METNENEAKANSEKDNENKERRESRATDSEHSNNSRPSEVETKKLSMESSVKSLHHHPRASSSKVTPETELEGEGQENLKEPSAERGPTLARYKYDRTKDDYEELSRNLRENAMKTMLKMLELQASQRPNNQTSAATTSCPPGQLRNQLAAGGSSKSLSSDFKGNLAGADLETQIKELDKKLKLAVSRVAESKREQAHLMSLINNLEVKMYRTEEAECIKEMMSKFRRISRHEIRAEYISSTILLDDGSSTDAKSTATGAPASPGCRLRKVPQEVDLEKMKRLQMVMMERKRLERDVQRLQMEIRAMNNAMASADVIISESAPIKKPRRVVIREASEAHPDSQSATRLISNEVAPGKCGWMSGNAPSPELDLPETSAPPVQDNDETVELRKRSAESEDEGEIKEGEVKATPSPTKGKKSKK